MDMKCEGLSIEDNAKWLEDNGCEFLCTDMYNDRVWEKHAGGSCVLKVYMSLDKRNVGMCRATLDVVLPSCNGLHFHTDWMRTAEAAVKAVVKSFRLSMVEHNRLLNALEGESAPVAKHKDLCRAIHAVLEDTSIPVMEVLLRRADGRLLSFAPGHDYRPAEDREDTGECFEED